MLEINQEQFKEYMTHDAVLVDFFATWCGPCKMLAPVLEKVQAQLEGKLEIVKVDIDANMDLADEYGIMSVPTMVLFKKGEVIGAISGYQPEGVLVQTLEKYL
ncbi:MAG: thioredoxin [Firmicutes bacterium]|nr:thioredoxin [Bacillota bacterium]